MATFLQIADCRLPIADCGSLTETAAARDVAQSAISRQLGAIERACGGKLFERIARGVRLNEVGRRLYPRVMTWVQEGRLLTHDLNDRPDEPTGLVRLGVIDSLATELYGPIYAALEKSFPKVRLHLVGGMSGRISESLDQGRWTSHFFRRTRGAEVAGGTPSSACRTC
jgi:LysR family nitrogen assimilation transcriptional regulator